MKDIKKKFCCSGTIKNNDEEGIIIQFQGDHRKDISEILKNDYIYTPLSDGNIETWTHQKCIDYLNGLKYKDNKMRNAAIVGINYDIKWIKEFVKEWRDLALIKECICPEGSDRKNHRQDQSLLTLLYYKYNDIHKFKIINNYIDSSIHRPLKK